MLFRIILVFFLVPECVGAVVWALHGTEPYLTRSLRALMVTVALVSLFAMALILHAVGPMT
jgi:hypothetical protein